MILAGNCGFRIDGIQNLSVLLVDVKIFGNQKKTSILGNRSENG
jgi:hypothetical protein